MITIHGRASSSNVQIVMWALGELDLPHIRHDAGGSFGGTDTADFRAMNPMGLVPVLQEGDLTLFESGAILRYLAARYGDPAFWPADPAARAPLDVWAEWAKTTLSPAVRDMFFATDRCAPARRDPARIDALARALRPLAAMLDARIGQGPWLAGDAFTFADIAVGHQLHRYFELPFARAETPALRAYWDRLCTRPAYRTHGLVGWDDLRITD